MIIYKKDANDLKLEEKKYSKIFKQVKYVDDVNIIKRTIKQDDSSYDIYFLFFEYSSENLYTKIFYITDKKQMEVESNNTDPEIFYAFKFFLNAVGEK